MVDAAYRERAVDIVQFEAEQEEGMFYEWRQYRTSLTDAPAFHQGFESVLLPSLRDAGFDLIGAWTVEIGEGGIGDLHWLLRWASLDVRTQAFTRARSDPRNTAFKREYGTQIVSTSNQILTPTRFSPLS